MGRRKKHSKMEFATWEQRFRRMVSENTKWEQSFAKLLAAGCQEETILRLIHEYSNNTFTPDAENEILKSQSVISDLEKLANLVERMAKQIASHNEQMGFLSVIERDGPPVSDYLFNDHLESIKQQQIPPEHKILAEKFRALPGVLLEYSKIVLADFHFLEQAKIKSTFSYPFSLVRLTVYVKHCSASSGPLSNVDITNLVDAANACYGIDVSDGSLVGNIIRDAKARRDGVYEEIEAETCAYFDEFRFLPLECRPQFLGWSFARYERERAELIKQKK